MEFAATTSAYIIEADSCGDLYYNTRPLPMKAQDKHGCVIYIKSFDRVLAPGMLSFIVCHSDISNHFRDTNQSPGYIQRGLDFYLRHCDFRGHCTFLRSQYARRWRRATVAIETYLSPFASFNIPDGGLSFWISPRTKFDYAEEFLKRKVLVAPGKLFMNGNAPHFRCCFASVQEERISEGIGIIASVFAKSFGEGLEL